MTLNTLRTGALLAPVLLAGCGSDLIEEGRRDHLISRMEKVERAALSVLANAELDSHEGDVRTFSTEDGDGTVRCEASRIQVEQTFEHGDVSNDDLGFTTGSDGGLTLNLTQIEGSDPENGPYGKNQFTVIKPAAGGDCTYESKYFLKESSAKERLKDKTPDTFSMEVCQEVFDAAESALENVQTVCKAKTE